MDAQFNPNKESKNETKSENHIPFHDLSWQWNIIKEKFLPEFNALVEKGQFCLGPAVEQFENAFARFVKTRYAVGVNSGTSALHLALIAAGIKAGDKVLVPAQTFIATIWPILYLGAIPVLCDVERDTGTIDIQDARMRLEPGTKAIIPVHLYGQPANMQAVMEFATQNQLMVIEDACQAHGAMYQNEYVGAIGLLGCYSFYPGKNLGAMGEAGMVVTTDEEVAVRLRALRHHGQHERYIHQEVGFNYRMEGIQGLALSHKLVHLEEWTHRRRQIAKRYIEGLSELPLVLPQIVHEDHVYHLFVIRTPLRDSLRTWLEDHKILTGLHYPVPMHRQPCLSSLVMDRNSFPCADEYSNYGLSLPMFEGLSDEQVDRVINTIRDFYDD